MRRPFPRPLLHHRDGRLPSQESDLGRQGSFRPEGVLELVQQFVEFLDVGRFRRLLALHGGHNDCVTQLEFFDVFRVVGFEPLSEKVVEHGFLEGLCVGFLVVDPAGELMGILRRILGEFIDLLASLFDGDPVGVHGFDDVVVIVDSAGNLAVRRSGGGKTKGSGGDDEEKGVFHDGVSVGRNQNSAIQQRNDRWAIWF